MLKLLKYLHGSELVAKFQRACGLFPIEAAHQNGNWANPPRETPLQDADAPDKLTRLRCGNGHAITNEQDSNSNDKHKENGYGVGVSARPQYEVRNRLLYFLFLVSAGLGHEVFYITFPPCLHWNLDPFLCRRLVNIWTMVMYIGQALKDVLKLPRPLSPPVVKLEKRVDAEYGLPSTHVMATIAIFFTLLLSAPSRVQFQFEVGLLVAVVLSVLVCLSRLYTGMHSALDVICGALISATLMLVTYPYWETFDRLQLTSPLSPIGALVLALFLSYTYPELDHYTTTRGDTTTILGVGAGCSVGYWVNERLGETFEPQGVLPIPLPALTLGGLALGSARFVVGVVALVATRQMMKTASLWVLCSWYGVSVKDRDARRRKEIEVPYKFTTYISIGLVHSILVNRLFIGLALL
ncbi:sphingosine-1-phosphate phosphatase 2-like isoform X1 [Coregonus clupeaformis]|uniref:sphingosine-1-phosphate phosphatase 2-like isoform X1 n=2 Tax=Coregonus clupeaformis TaxID=59861 RepID=UPI001BE052AC|nr:sphingosine-1-phosphate phosphatase 2-like isoform X1 [Coregonus clupeaformis]